MFSVIIPTLQRSDRLSPLVELYGEHDLVDEVIIINNAGTPLDAGGPKVGALIGTEMSASSASPEFGAVKAADRQRYQNQHGDGDYAARHRIGTALWWRARQAVRRGRTLRHARECLRAQVGE